MWTRENSNLLFSFMTFFSFSFSFFYFKSAKLLAKTLKSKAQFTGFCKISAQKFIFQVPGFIWRAWWLRFWIVWWWSGEQGRQGRAGVMFSTKFYLMNPMEKCRPATWWQNNGVSDLWLAINNSCFQAPYSKQVFYESAPELTHVLLFISANFPGFHFFSWQRVKKIKQLQWWQLQITWFILFFLPLFGFITNPSSKERNSQEEILASVR